ncbi:MAG: GntR family transcriptional regulator [Saprospiraceae bacterium]|nr:GntR family transcriptional regulator [Saprospiraceae bacterium]MBP6445259.1 GntR family transcriptional regulator [Saprospiraceae bacterium]
MDFKASKSIYQQIAESICDRIISENLQPGDRIESVRDMAAKMGVNQNTILKTYTDLQQVGVIENQRGIGYFVSETSKQIIFNQRKKEFYDDILPEFLKQASLIRLTKEDILPFLNTLNQTIS